MASWVIREGSVGIERSAYLENQDGDPLDLTGLTATLKVWTDDPDNPILTTLMTVIEPLLGFVKWTISVSDSAKLPAGTYLAEIELTSPGYIDSTDSFIISVKPSP